MNKNGQYKDPFRATLKGVTDLYRKKETVKLPNQMNLSGKTVMITGASSGLGLATAKRVAQLGAKVIMAVRSGIPEKGHDVMQASGSQDVEMYYVDLADFKSIDALIQNLKNDGHKIDILISNAAMVALKGRRSPQGLEEMFMVNYLAAFYLINSILVEGLINEASSDDARIIIVSSESHRDAQEFKWDEFGNYHDYGVNETVSRYGYFKLLLTTYAHELGERLKNERRKIKVKTLCPGPVNTNIAREAPLWMKPLLKIVFGLFFRSPEKASDPIIYFTTTPIEEMEEKPINYLFLMEPKEMDFKAVQRENGAKLWKMSEDLISKNIG